MKLLVACECSQVVAAAFRGVGVEAYSCDILPCQGGHPDWHIIGDAVLVVKGHGSFMLENGGSIDVAGCWGMVIAHPPCTMLTHASAIAFAKGWHTIEQVESARRFFLEMLNAPAAYVAVENPAPMKWIGLPDYSQKLQPYDFGHPYSKRVCLWLRGLPPLLPLYGSFAQHRRWTCVNHDPGMRAKTFERIAEAMAVQWSKFLMI